MKLPNWREAEAGHTYDRLHFEQIQNARDLACCNTSGGVRIQPGRLLRCGNPGFATMADIARLQALKIDVVLDFRTQAEKQSTEQQFANAFNWIADPVQVGNLSQDMVMPLLQNGTAQNSRQFMIDVYGDFPTLYQLQYKRFLTLAEQNKTMLYHCTAGKDRTGFASLLLLSALGVDQRVIIADYLASNRYVAASNAQMLAQIAKADLSPQVLEPFLLVDPAYIAASLQVIDDNYGGMMSYLHDVLNVDVECIRGNYLMPSSCV